jgi:hypothetical protein
MSEVPAPHLKKNGSEFTELCDAWWKHSALANVMKQAAAIRRHEGYVAALRRLKCNHADVARAA